MRMLPEVISISVAARTSGSWTILRLYRFSFHDTNTFITHKIAPKGCRIDALMDSDFPIAGIPAFYQIIGSSLTRLMRCWRYVNIARIFNDRSVQNAPHYTRHGPDKLRNRFYSLNSYFKPFQCENAIKYFWMKCSTWRTLFVAGWQPIDDSCQLGTFRERSPADLPGGRQHRCAEHSVSTVLHPLLLNSFTWKPLGNFTLCCWP